MGWESERIRELRATARMTQRELAHWLGVTIKQVKHLEHQRRNPSGPTTRLLEMLSERIRGKTNEFVELPAVQPQQLVTVLGTSTRTAEADARMVTVEQS